MKRWIFVVLLFLGALLFFEYTQGPYRNKAITSVSPSPLLSECEIEMNNDVNILKVDTFTGDTPIVDFSTSSDAELFKTKITEAVSNGPNLAGHYVLASWGCGTDCVGYAVVDDSSGEIIHFQPANENYHLRSDFSLESRVFILDPVNAGMERKYFEVLDYTDSNPEVRLLCSEVSIEDMYRKVDE